MSLLAQVQGVRLNHALLFGRRPSYAMRLSWAMMLSSKSFDRRCIISHSAPFFYTAIAIFAEPPVERRVGAISRPFRPPNSLLLHFFLLNHNFLQVARPILTLWSEPQGFGFPPGERPMTIRPRASRVWTMTDVPLVARQGPHQLLMTARDHAAGALVVRRSPVQDTFLPSGEALGCHRGPL